MSEFETIVILLLTAIVSFMVVGTIPAIIIIALEIYNRLLILGEHVRAKSRQGKE